MGSQEVSKPMVLTVIAVVVVVVGVLGWYYFMKPQTYPGYQAPPGGAAAAARGAPRLLPGMNVQQPGGPYGTSR